MLDGHGHGGVTFKGKPARQHLVQHHAGGIDVGAGVDTVAPRLLGGNIMDGAQRLLRQGLAGVGQTGDAEIGHLYAAVPQHHDILWLDVPVDNAPAVGMAEAAHDLGDEMQRLSPVHAAPPFHILLQGDPVDQLHDDILRLTAGRDIVHRDDIGMGQLCHSPGLVPEAAAEIGVVRQIALEDLDGHQPVQAMTSGLIYIRHAAGTDQLQNFVAIVQHTSYVLIHVCHLLYSFISSTAVILSGAPRCSEICSR